MPSASDAVERHRHGPGGVHIHRREFGRRGVRLRQVDREWSRGGRSHGLHQSSGYNWRIAARPFRRLGRVRHKDRDLSSHRRNNEFVLSGNSRIVSARRDHRRKLRMAGHLGRLVGHYKPCVRHRQWVHLLHAGSEQRAAPGWARYCKRSHANATASIWSVSSSQQSRLVVSRRRRAFYAECLRYVSLDGVIESKLDLP